MKKRFVLTFTELTILIVLFLLIGCTSMPKLEDYQNISFSEFRDILKDSAASGERPRQGRAFIVKGYFIFNDGEFYFMETPNDNGGIVLNSSYTNREELLNTYGDYDCERYHSHQQVANYDRENLRRLIDQTKEHIVYIGFYRGRTSWETCIDRIEGLRTIEEADALEKAEAERRVRAWDGYIVDWSKAFASREEAQKWADDIFERSSNVKNVIRARNELYEKAVRVFKQFPSGITLDEVKTYTNNMIEGYNRFKPINTELAKITATGAFFEGKVIYTGEPVDPYWSISFLAPANEEIDRRIEFYNNEYEKLVDTYPID